MSYYGTYDYIFELEKTKIIEEQVLKSKLFAEYTGREELYNHLLLKQREEEELQRQLRIIQKNYYKKKN